MNTRSFSLRIDRDMDDKLTGHFTVVNQGLSMSKKLDHEKCADIIQRLSEPLMLAVADASDIDIDLAVSKATD